MTGWEFVCICTMFHVLHSKVFVDRGIGTIDKTFYICYCQGSIVLTVCADSLYFSHIRFSFFIPHPLLCYFCMVFPRPLEFMYRIEVFNSICC